MSDSRWALPLPSEEGTAYTVPKVVRAENGSSQGQNLTLPLRAAGPRQRSTRRSPKCSQTCSRSSTSEAFSRSRPRSSLAQLRQSRSDSALGFSHFPWKIPKCSPTSFRSSTAGAFSKLRPRSRPQKWLKPRPESGRDWLTCSHPSLLSLQVLAGPCTLS